MTTRLYRAVMQRAWDRLDSPSYSRAQLFYVRSMYPTALASWLRRFRMEG